MLRSETLEIQGRSWDQEEISIREKQIRQMRGQAGRDDEERYGVWSLRLERPDKATGGIEVSRGKT